MKDLLYEDILNEIDEDIIEFLHFSSMTDEELLYNLDNDVALMILKNRFIFTEALNEKRKLSES